MKNRLLQVLFWSIISAAFIGPGTVTTAALSGASFGYSLVWALLLATFICYVLQEACARLLIITQKNLGQALKIWLSGSKTGKGLLYFIMLAVVFGCIAFESGNLVGAVAGLELILAWEHRTMLVLTFFIALLVLYFGKIRHIAVLLGILVAIMGLGFALTLAFIPIDWFEVFSSGFLPNIPHGAAFLVVGLIGTTVVPYNLFLGSGMKHQQSLKEMRWSLAIAIGIGGFISIAVLLVGTLVSDPFSFEALAQAIALHWGSTGKAILGLGLFGAGLSSTITAALAAALTVKSVIEKENEWNEDSNRFRGIWALVLGSGFVIGLVGWKPISLIVLAQVFNGIILPVLAISLWLLYQEPRIFRSALKPTFNYLNLLGLVAFVCTVIGLHNMAKGIPSYPDWGLFLVALMSILFLFLARRLSTRK